MQNPKNAEDFSLELRRTYSASRERMFQAWTQPEQLKKWFGPKSCTCPEFELDLRVGGLYRFVLEEPEGKHIGVGEYVEITPPDKLVFTLKWENTTEDSPEMLVTVQFLPKGDGTEMVLTHERNPSAEVRDSHGQGWISSFDCLDEVLGA